MIINNYYHRFHKVLSKEFYWDIHSAGIWEGEGMMAGNDKLIMKDEYNPEFFSFNTF